MMKRTTILTPLLLFVAATLWAQGPNNTGTYYEQANGRKGAALKTALFAIIKDPDVVSYAALKDAYQQTDVRPDGYLRDWYSSVTHYVPGSNFGTYKGEGDAYNREHCMPQSWYSQGAPMKSDIVQVIPTDGYINNMRSSNPYGEVDPSASNYKQSAGGYSKSGNSRTPGYTGVVFEPNDEVKGDIARIYFYMMTCYEDRILSWQKGTATSVIDGSGGTKQQPLQQWVLDMLLRWSKLDPVDATERARNAACYEVQRNRNPFVDYPGLEDYIWGDRQDEAFSYDHFDEVDVTFVAEPSFSVPAGTYQEAQTVALSTATEGATIYYTLDDTHPTTASTRYSGPITISETTTVKAIAATAESQSTVAQATYVIREADIDTPVAGEFARVTSASQLSDGDVIVIVNEESGLALSTEQRTNNRGVAAVTFESNRVNVTDKVQQIVLTAVDGGWLLTVDGGELYTQASGNRLLTSTKHDDSHYVTITITDGDAAIVFPEIAGRELRYNASASLFSCYTQGQKPVQIFCKQKSVPTSIREMNREQCTMDSEQGTMDGEVYDLQGRRVDSSMFNVQFSMLKKGLYIWGGKKILVK